MTRKEEIKQAASNSYPVIKGGDDKFIQGAEWADEHPRKGLVDIDRACEWLKNTEIGTFPYKLIEEFRKAMEE